MSAPEQSSSGVNIKRQRRCNFSEGEINLLVDEATLQNRVLSSSLTNVITAKTKQRAWEDIVQKINANHGQGRTAADIRKKWNDLRCQAKKHAQMHKRSLSQTGGGSQAAPVSEIYEKVLSIMPSCQVNGIEGGLETTLGTPASVYSTSQDVTLTASPVESEAALPEDSVVTCAASETCATSETSTVNKESQSGTVDRMLDVQRRILLELRQLNASQKKLVDIETERLKIENRRLELQEAKARREDPMYLSIDPVIEFSS